MTKIFTEIGSKDFFMSDKYQKPLVTCQFYGQLGNQLFITSTTLAYAWDYDCTPIFPGLHTEKNRTSYNKDRIFFRLDASSPPRQFKHLYREVDSFFGEEIPFHEDVVLDGYFQNIRYFDHHRDRLLQIFSPSELVENKLSSKYRDLLCMPNTVGVHVRTSGVRLHNTNQFPFLGLEYFEQAMSHFSDDSVFVIFSDRINWCKKYFSQKFSKKLVFIEGNDGIEDLFLMSKCKNNIICNSTFSWWGAYLNQNPEKKIIVPEQWQAGPQLHPNPWNNLYLSDWITAPYTLNPYPEDMYCYDESSQSCDPVWWN